MKLREDKTKGMKRSRVDDLVEISKSKESQQVLSVMHSLKDLPIDEQHPVLLELQEKLLKETAHKSKELALRQEDKN